MGLYSISHLSRFSGIKPHTIRAWEARYKALTPSRSSGNTRFYDNAQMKRLLNMVSLVNAGYRASEVGSMPDDKLHHLLESIVGPRCNATEEYFISQLIAAGLSYDDTRFEEILGHCISRYRLKNTYRFVLLPMLERIGLLWRCDKASPAHEHFVSNLLRKKLFASVDSLSPAHPDADRWLLLLPENEFHELGLLLAYNIIRLSGQKAVYLGANVPFASITSAIREISPDRLLIFTLQPELSKPLASYLKDLDRSFPGKRIYLAGNPARPADASGCRNIHWLNNVEDLTRALNDSDLARA
ncbi:MAG: MerR family transcriptional regulator [Bacteroidetes bacterium]|nr:MerR family transcriptional regulator [Bacteroidota bacterium]